MRYCLFVKTISCLNEHKNSSTVFSFMCSNTIDYVIISFVTKIFYTSYLVLLISYVIICFVIILFEIYLF